jgi:catechol 2,3-dioxygenase-like lactoylglutathione lyase family enzyme
MSRIEGVCYVHTNLIAHDVDSLVRFYEEVLGCTKVPPARDQAGAWLERATRVPRAHLRGHHLRLPGHGPEGPTLEVFAYDEVLPQSTPAPNRAGFGHLAFVVADVEEALAAILAAGGSALGEVVEVEVPGAGSLCFTYARDPEGNILELQRWSR